MALLHRLYELITVLDYPGLDHLTKQVVTFPGTFSHSGED